MITAAVVGGRAVREGGRRGGLLGAALDNLVKGGNAVQCVDIRFGPAETDGLHPS